LLGSVVNIFFVLIFLEGGGDIEVDDDLKEFSKIALIKRSNVNFPNTFKKKSLRDWPESID